MPQAPKADSSSVSSEPTQRVSLSEDWKSILAKSPKAPPVVWSYYELGFDVTGQGDPERGKLLRSILAHLRWPKGSSGFVPAGLPDSGSIQPDMQSAWTAIAELGAHTLICLGTDAADILCPDHGGRTTLPVGDVSVIILPTLADLGAMLPHDRLTHLDRLAEIRL